MKTQRFIDSYRYSPNHADLFSDNDVGQHCDTFRQPLSMPLERHKM